MNFAGKFVLSLAFAAAGGGLIYGESTTEKLQQKYPSLTVQDASALRYERAVNSGAFLWAIGGFIAFNPSFRRRNAQNAAPSP